MCHTKLSKLITHFYRSGKQTGLRSISNWIRSRVTNNFDIIPYRNEAGNTSIISASQEKPTKTNVLCLSSLNTRHMTSQWNSIAKTFRVTLTIIGTIQFSLCVIHNADYILQDHRQFVDKHTEWITKRKANKDINVPLNMISTDSYISIKTRQLFQITELFIIQARYSLRNLHLFKKQYIYYYYYYALIS